MKQADLRIPLEYTNSFFDDYVSFSLGEDFFYNKSYFGNGSYAHDSFQYYSNIHKAKIFSDLTKKYERFTHVMQPSLAYVKPGYESQRPVDFEDLTKEQKELFTVGVPEENYLFSLGQYFYDESMKLKFYQRLSQIYNVDRKKHFGDLSNEMQYNWQKWQLYNNVVYSNEFKEIRESSSRITYIRPEYHFTVGHTFKQNLPDQTTLVPANDVNFNFGYTYNRNIGFNGSITYNIDDELSEQWSFGGSYKEDCWSMAASMRRSITPRPTGETIDDTFYIQFNFIPFITVGSN
jgi:LPS-assembly protein